MKKDELYARLLRKKVVTIGEILKAAEGIVANPTRTYVLKKYVQKFLDEGKLVRIRRGLYACLDPSQSPSSFTPDKFLAGSKIKEEGFLGYHTALEFHGFANSAVYNTIYVCIEPSKRFNEFSFSNFRFKAVSPKDRDTKITEENHLGHLIHITDRERTFVDCLERVSYAGGWEECLKSLESVRGLNFDSLINYLLSKGNDFLVRKAGFVLELLKSSSAFYDHLSENKLEELAENIGKSPRYIEGAREAGEKPVRNEKWNLYVQPWFKERFFQGV